MTLEVPTKSSNTIAKGIAGRINSLLIKILINQHLAAQLLWCPWAKLNYSVDMPISS